MNVTTAKILFETPRLIVRQLHPNDLDDFYAICGNAELMQYSGDSQPLTYRQAQLWLEVSLKNYQTKGFGCAAVIDKASGAFIGYCGLVYPPNSAQVEIIYALQKASWGHGLATEVAGAMLKYGFEQHGLQRIVASIDPANSASVRVAEKLGMIYQSEETDEHGLPTAFYAIEREA